MKNELKNNGRQQNRNLRFKILEKFRTSRAFSEACKIDQSTISKFINGSREPSEEQKTIISRTLRESKKKLFPAKRNEVILKVSLEQRKSNS